MNREMEMLSILLEVSHHGAGKPGSINSGTVLYFMGSAAFQVILKICHFIHCEILGLWWDMFGKEWLNMPIL